AGPSFRDGAASPDAARVSPLITRLSLRCPRVTISPARLRLPAFRRVGPPPAGRPTPLGERAGRPAGDMIGLSPPHACRPMPVEHSPSLIAALRAAAEPHGEVDERLMFGCHFMLLNGKI